MADQSQPNLDLPVNFSPDQLDITTELSALLSRLRTPVNLPGVSTSTTGQTPAAPTPSQQPSGSQSQSQSTGDISLRDFPASTDHLRLKLQGAKTAVLALPDMDKSIVEQEAEIRQLEDKIRRQREQIAALREKGIKFATTDKMQE
ncbi:hypothetical protein SCUP515_04480 [Seiridium cupressi]